MITLHTILVGGFLLTVGLTSLTRAAAGSG